MRVATIVGVALAVTATACTGSASDPEAGPTTSRATAAVETTPAEATAPSEVDAETALARPPMTESDVVAVADALDAGVVVAWGSDAVIAWHEGETLTIPIDERVGVWSDGDFVYLETWDGGGLVEAAAVTLDGDVVCISTELIHHATARDDGTFVMATQADQPERSADDGGTFPLPAAAVDCATGAEEPIEPLTVIGSDGQQEFVEWHAGRRFVAHGDAEGNADLLNENGLVVNGDDYAGWFVFTPDATKVAYGDMGVGASPHYSNVVKARDTATGDLLWSATLDLPFNFLAHFSDRVVAGLPTDYDALVGGRAAVETLVVLSGDDGSEVDRVPVGFDLVFVGE